jgi:hypothetical protein
VEPIGERSEDEYVEGIVELTARFAAGAGCRFSAVPRHGDQEGVGCMASTSTKSLAAVALLAAALAAPYPAGAQGDGVDRLRVRPTGDRVVPTWEFEPADATAGDPPCGNARYVLSDGPEGEGPVIDESRYEVVPGEDGSVGTIIGHSLDSGEHELRIYCDRPEGNGAEQPAADYAGFLTFGRLTVTKVVEGQAPEGATFVVVVDCGPEAPGPPDGANVEAFSVELVFPAGGGTHPVIAYRYPTCQITETDDGGAQSTEIRPATVHVEDHWGHEARVTNTFVSPPPPPVSDDEPPRVATPETVAQPAAVARPVEATPTLTG